jgi:hypothetical protein
LNTSWLSLINLSLGVSTLADTVFTLFIKFKAIHSDVQEYHILQP